ncbi:DUF7793 family protein [Aequorivita antarctica]|uniref:DUF7793 domain-containing protein n=1 Tax=Aequorivita antarctica TaxID=153266 RepID=A0A5C6Z0R6_9FLAO|nr:hypothetical protein [Aequorivita antarctica]TXD73562.1 hypothetical protein ESU54_07300 [Aequorivita antarctica]
MLNYIENSYASYKFMDDIVYIRYHIGITIDRKAAVKIVEDRLILQEGQTFPVLCDIRGVKDINKSARDYLAIEGSMLIKAVAFIVEPPLSEIMSKFYLKASKPPIPSRAFQTMEEAKEFLNEYI